MCFAQGPQCSDADETRARSSQALFAANISDDTLSSVNTRSVSDYRVIFYNIMLFDNFI